jgi:hypothetical protein
MKLNPVSYNPDVSGLNEFQSNETNVKDMKNIKKAEQIRHNGFIAQDVEQAARAVNYDLSGLNSQEMRRMYMDWDMPSLSYPWLRQYRY